MMPKWDENNGRILLYDSRTAEVQISSLDRQEQTVKINILKDFPGAVQTGIFDIASGRHRSVVVACTLKYSEPQTLKTLILTYDSTGKLTKIWDIAPYNPGAISSDESGNIFAFGARFDAGREARALDYEMLVEYDEDGRVVKKMLPSSLFPAEVDPTAYSEDTGPPFLRVSGDKIYVYTAMLGEVYIFNKSRDLLKHYSTKPFLNNVAASQRYTSYIVIAGAFDADGNLYFDIGLDHPVIKDLPSRTRVGAKLVADSPQSSVWHFSREGVGQDSHLDERLIGVSADGSVVSLARANGKATIRIAKHD